MLLPAACLSPALLCLTQGSIQEQLLPGMYPEICGHTSGCRAVRGPASSSHHLAKGKCYHYFIEEKLKSGIRAFSGSKNLLSCLILQPRGLSLPRHYGNLGQVTFAGLILPNWLRKDSRSGGTGKLDHSSKMSLPLWLEHGWCVNP